MGRLEFLRGAEESADPLAAVLDDAVLGVMAKKREFFLR